MTLSRSLVVVAAFLLQSVTNATPTQAPTTLSSTQATESPTVAPTLRLVTSEAPSLVPSLVTRSDFPSQIPSVYPTLSEAPSVEPSISAPPSISSLPSLVPTTTTEPSGKPSSTPYLRTTVPTVAQPPVVSQPTPPTANGNNIFAQDDVSWEDRATMLLGFLPVILIWGCLLYCVNKICWGGDWKQTCGGLLCMCLLGGDCKSETDEERQDRYDRNYEEIRRRERETYTTSYGDSGGSSYQPNVFPANSFAPNFFPSNS